MRFADLVNIFPQCIDRNGMDRLTSRLNRTPPMGAPKATDMPEAAAADRTSLFRASFWSRFGKNLINKFEQQQAT